MPRRIFLFVLGVLVLVGSSSIAQQCPVAPDLAGSAKQANFFNEMQEAALGDIFAAKIAQDLHVIEDDAVAGYVQKIGDRLLKQMPPSELRFRFYVVDSPDANAFAIAGGRVYVTRKLIVTVKSEDELAGVIAHELGHQLAHHSAVQWTRIFKDVLSVTAVSDRADIEDKYNEFLDTYHT
jgi:predicted Zn-dependent protease